MVDYTTNFGVDNGEKWGDLLQKMKEFFEEKSNFCIYRYDESTFCFLFPSGNLSPGITNINDSYELEERIKQDLIKFKKEFEIKIGKTISFRIGAAVNLKEDHIKYCALALQSARKNDSLLAFFHEGDQVKIREENLMRDRIDTALLKNNKNIFFVPYYQRIYNPKNPQQKKVEALARLVVRDPKTRKETVYSPDKFIPIIIKELWIPRLTAIMIRKVLLDIKKDPELFVSINIHEQDWNRGSEIDIMKKLEDIPEKLKKQICIEILEECGCQRLEDRVQINTLKTSGFKISLDDY